MNNENIVLELEELLKRQYILSSERAVEFINFCDLLGEKIHSIDEEKKDFYLYIIQHLRLFFNSEFMYHSNLVEKALKSYQKMKENLSITQTEFPDLYATWQYDIDRLIYRTEARIQELKAQFAVIQEDYIQADVLFVETLNRYNVELEFEQKNEDYEHYFDSLAHIFYNTGLLYRIRGKTTKNQADLYQALKNLRKAEFLGKTGFSALIDEIKEEKFSFTQIKLENQADTFFTKGLTESEMENYNIAKNMYQKSAQIYRSLNHLKPAFEYELQEQIQISSYYEATAKNYMIQDMNEEAAKQFSNASQILQQLLTKLNNEVLSLQFAPQIKYFDAMELFCQAVTEYDKLDTKAAEHFDLAQKMLNRAKLESDEQNNQPLAKSCTDALARLNSYQEIVELMLSPSQIDREETLDEFKENLEEE
ncbi:MAG: hypothetical protein EAX86_01125 [Candidatus Heimdallarchaeota archaeon]|nr:hypothetical protein [Candidatus Heimdallarchaeota archaeon]